MGGMDFGLDLEDFYIIFTYVHGFPRFISRILLGLAASRAVISAYFQWQKADVRHFNGLRRVYVYFPKMDIGPYTSQVRMTCKIKATKNLAEVQAHGFIHTSQPFDTRFSRKMHENAISES